MLSGWCLEGTKIIEICQKGDQLLEEEIAKVYKGKKIAKGKFHRCALNVSRVKQKKKQKEKDSTALT